MKQFTDRQIEQLLKAEYFLTSVYWDMHDEQDERTLKKLDTILEKLYNFMNLQPKKV